MCGYVSVGKDCAWLSVLLVLVFTAVRVVCGFVSVGKVCACLSVVLVLMFTAVCDLYGWTIAATATVVISCSSSADMCCESVCVEMSVVVVSPGCAYDSVWDSVKLISGNYALNYFQYQEDVGVSAC